MLRIFFSCRKLKRNELSMHTWSLEIPRVKINWEVAFEEFNESKMCGNIKRKRDSFEPKMEKILAWKYSNEFWYFGHIFLLWYRINLILMVTERGLEDLKLCGLPKFQNLPYLRPKLTWKLTHCWKTRIDILYFPFWGLGF